MPGTVDRAGEQNEENFLPSLSLNSNKGRQQISKILNILGGKNIRSAVEKYKASKGHREC